MSTILNENTQYVDASGRPLAGGSIYIGDVDADPVANPKPIFSDRDLTVPLTNPQTLDANGRSVNKIWLDGKYSLQVNDINSVQVFQDIDRGESTENISITGNISLGGDVVSDSAGSVEWILDKGVSGDISRIWGYTAGLARWAVDFGDASAEGGADSGSDFAIKAYDDAGTFVFDAIKINRDDRQILSGGELTFVNDNPIAWNAGPTIKVGAGTPEGAVDGQIGSLFLRTDGGAGTSLYVKESGSSNTGWVGK